MIVDNVKALCKRKHVSIAAVERAAGLGNGSIRRWDSMQPGIWNIKAVADYFGVTVDSLLKQHRPRKDGGEA